MKRLYLAEGIYPQICNLAQQYKGEFAVMLFGRIEGQEYTVTDIVPPGENSENEWAFCCNDQDHESASFAELRCAKPGILWLGDFHAHPPGMPWLSTIDLRTIHNILLATDETFHPTEYVAGVMLRAPHGLDIIPMHFTREDLNGSPMEIRHEGIHSKPKGTRNPLYQAYCHCRRWISRQRTRRHVGPSRRGHDHPHRP